MEKLLSLRAERQRREARRETFTTPKLVTIWRSILGPPAEGRPGPSNCKWIWDNRVSLGKHISLYIRNIFHVHNLGGAWITWVWPVYFTCWHDAKHSIGNFISQNPSGLGAPVISWLLGLKYNMSESLLRTICWIFWAAKFSVYVRYTALKWKRMLSTGWWRMTRSHWKS